MTDYRVYYEGPAALAVPAATQLADADGVELTASDPPRRREGADGVVLALTLSGTHEAVSAALDAVQAELPDGATVAFQGDPDQR